jgi:hypothetical protein
LGQVVFDAEGWESSVFGGSFVVDVPVYFLTMNPVFGVLIT